MTILRNHSNSNSNSNMQRPKIRTSPGWAAFDQKHRSKDYTKVETNKDIDPFPCISGSPTVGPTNSLAKNNPTPNKSFSSVVHPKTNNPGLNSKTDINLAIKQLKESHNWADESLIKDVLTGVNNDADKASDILKSMVSDSNNLETGESSKSGETSSSTENKDKFMVEETIPDMYINNLNPRVFSVPVEPEWQEDDLYLNHRKDALKMMRAASSHSRAASNAFLRGDHLSAHQLSQQARGEWARAEKLNSEAAEEILRLRNANNDLWKLDLHGLHSSESVRALEGHLHKIESLNQSKMESKYNNDRNNNNDNKDVGVARPRQAVLQVITGMGNHSRGQASLPAAVKTFLIDNGYRFEEPRPGVISVRPKFRHK